MKYFKRFLTLALCIALALSVAACDKEIGVTLVDFEDETVSVEAGTVYTVENPTVRDTEGNSYRATYAVNTSGGDSVTVVDDQFNVTSMEGYVITYTVTAAKEYTRKLTIGVTDTTGPQITVEEPAVGTVDVPYTLPAIRVYDAADGAIAPEVKVLFGETEQTIASDNTFTPKSVGEYTLTVNAKDSRGNTAAAVTKTFYVMPKGEKNELTAFSFGASELTNVARSSFTNMGSSSGKETVFEGRTGVAWQTAGEMAGGAKYSYAMSFDKTAEQITALLEEYGGEGDYFSMDLYIDTDDAVSLLFHGGVYSVSGDTEGTNLVKGKTWTRVYMPVSMLLEQMPAWGYAGDYLNQYTPAQFFVTQTVLKSNPYGAYFFDMLEKDYKIYFDKVAFYHKMDISLTVEPEQVAHGGTGAFVYTLGGADSQTASLVITDPDGNVVTAQEATAAGGKVVPEKMGTYTFMYTAANGCDVVVKKAECVSPYSIHAAQISDTHIGATVTIPTGELYDNNAGAAVEATVDAEVKCGDRPVTLDGNAFLAKEAGEYTVTYTARYRDETFTLSDTFTIFGNKFVFSDFNDSANQPTELNPQVNIRGGQAGYATEPVGGRNGVAWMTQSNAGQGNTFSLGYSCAAEDIARYLDAGVNAYFTLWVYVDAVGQFEFVQYDDYFGVADENGVIYGERFVQGKTWTKIYISGEALYGNVAWVAGAASSLTDMVNGQLKGGVGIKLFNVSGAGYTAQTKIYIDEFAVEAPCYVALKTDKQEYTVGETANLQVTDALEQGYAIRVKTPASEEYVSVTGTAFELTAGAGNYQFVLTVPGTAHSVAVTVSALPLPGTYTIKTETVAETSVGSSYTLPKANLYDAQDVKVEDAAVTVESVKFGSKNAVFDGDTLVLKQAGEYTVNYVCEYAYQTIRASATVTALPDKLVVSDFNDPANKAAELDPHIGIRGGQAGYATEPVGGREGVAWMTQGGGIFAFGHSCDLTDVARYAKAGVGDYVTLWVYVDAEGQFEFAQGSGAFSVADENGAVFGSRTVAGKTWTKIYIGAEELAKSSTWITGVPDVPMADMFTGQMPVVGLKLFNVVGLAADAKVYIDELAIEKASPVTMTADQESYAAGDTLTLQIDNPLARDYRIKVKTPASETFVALASETLVLEYAGDYQFILTMPGRVDQIVFTVSVRAAAQ